MKDPLLQVVKEFLSRHLVYGKPILLGLSGGPDSLALLHLILECKRFFPIDLHVAHIDHGWREESEAESLALQAYVEAIPLPFYLHRLTKKAESNLEEAAREERLKFFFHLMEEMNCQALVLGHQADDKAETILKRILEGADLFSLGGMQTVSSFEGKAIWRPCLGISKVKLQGWLDKRGLVGIDDPTNRDTRFLRSRMRLEIFPSLADKFGKQVSSRLASLGDAAHEVKEYLLQNIERYIDEVKREASGGLILDLRPFYPLKRLEMKMLLMRLIKEEGGKASAVMLETFLLQLLERKANYVCRAGKKIISIDRGLLLIANTEMVGIKRKTRLK
jgi:tRNA(Ile)-lysidine synthase